MACWCLIAYSYLFRPKLTKTWFPHSRGSPPSEWNKKNVKFDSPKKKKKFLGFVQI